VQALAERQWVRPFNRRRDSISVASTESEAVFSFLQQKKRFFNLPAIKRATHRKAMELEDELDQTRGLIAATTRDLLADQTAEALTGIQGLPR
jgi:hypothetical protein